MDYQIQISYKRKIVKGFFKDIANIGFAPENTKVTGEQVENVIECHSQNFVGLLRGLILLYETSDFDAANYKNLDNENLIAEIQKIHDDKNSLISVKKNLQEKVDQLSQNKLSKEITELKERVKQAEQAINSKEQENQKLNNELTKSEGVCGWLSEEKQTLQKDLEESKKKYNQLINDWNNLIADYNILQKQRQSSSYLSKENRDLIQENEKLKKSKNRLEEQNSSIQKELAESQRKLAIATSRLHQQTVKPGIAGGGSRSDQLKNDFINLKMGLFREASSQVLNYWRKQDAKLTFRSAEFAQIRFVLSQYVFINSMSYFTGSKPEINMEVGLIISELMSVQGLNINQSMLPDIEQKIETVLLRSKGLDDSDEILIKHVEATTGMIIEDLNNIRTFEPPEDVLQEIKNFVEVGLKLVREIVNDSSSGELYMPEKGDEFNESLHETRDEPEAKIELTICAGYRTPGNVLVKAEVITISEPQTNANESGTPITTNSESKTQANANESGELTTSNESRTPTTIDNESKTQVNANESGKSTTSNESRTPTIVNNESKTQVNANESGELTTSNESQTHQGIYSINFQGKVIAKEGVYLHHKTQNDRQARETLTVPFETLLKFSAWTHGDEMQRKDGSPDRRWYWSVKYNFWVPAVHIEGEPRDSSPLPSDEGGHSNDQQ